jgi:hypothetical protein
MICPQCQAEYRQGFTRCADCDVDLVYALPAVPSVPEEPSLPAEPSEKLRSLWAGADMRLCAEHCAKLQDAGIPFKVIRREERLFNRNTYPDLEIAVPPSLYEKAEETIGDEDVPWPVDEAEEQAAIAFPAEDDVAATEDGDDNWDPENWYPTDATVEVWSESTQGLTWMIESSLRENRIHSRTDTLEDGACKIFVVPEAELRAQEIIKEIVDGTPRP